MNEEKQRLQIAEVEIRIKDMILECARNIKLVVVLVVLCAVAFIALGVVSASEADSVKTKYTFEEACEMLEEAEMETVEELVMMTEQEIMLGEYIKTSEKMKADCYNMPVSVIEIHLDVVDREAEIDALTLYHDYVVKGGLAKDIVLETEKVQYVKELISCSDVVKSGNDQISTNFWIQVVASTDEKNDELIQRIKEQLNKYKKTVDKTIGTHSIIIVNEIDTVVIDESLKTYQETQKKNLETLKTKVEEGKGSLTSMQLFVYNSMLEKVDNVLIKEVKSVPYVLLVILGCVLGTIVAVFIILVRFVFDKTIKNNNEVQNMYGIRNLGMVYQNKSNKYEQKLNEFAYGKGVNKCSDILFANVNNLFKGSVDKLAVVGVYDETEFKTFKNVLSDSEGEIVSVGNVLCERDAILSLPNYNDVIIMVKERTLTYSELYQLLLTCEEQNINVLGYVTIS